MSGQNIFKHQEVDVGAGAVTLAGDLRVPVPTKGLIVFAHGSGSSRKSPRNVAVAQVLIDAGFATLLFDLLTEQEASDRNTVFDIELLAQRLQGATIWLRLQEGFANIALGYFGASTGAAAALWAAADSRLHVQAIVSRGGRVDMASPKLADVKAPTLLLVGEFDDVVIDLNRQAKSLLRCTNKMVIIPGATHLFEEPGALDQVAMLATDWFSKYLLQ